MEEHIASKYNIIFVKISPHLYTWDKVFKNGPNKFCGRQPLRNLKGYSLLKQTISLLSSTNFTWSVFEYFVPFQGKHEHGL